MSSDKKIEDMTFMLLVRIFLPAPVKGPSLNGVPRRSMAILWTAAFVWCVFIAGAYNSAVVKAAAADTGEPNSSPTAIRSDIVRSIEFEGNQKFKDKILRQRIGIELGDQIDPFLAEGARRTIIDVYKKIGYIFVEVTMDKAMAQQGQLFFKIVEGPRVRVDRVKFEGNHVFSSSTLKKILKTKTHKWFYLPAYYSEQNVLDDTEKLREFYYNRGYLGYDVEVQHRFVRDNQGVVVTFIIAEGPPYTIDQIVFTGNTFFEEQSLKDDLTLTEGQVYKKAKAELDNRTLRDKYREKGFVNAIVVQEPKFSPDPNDNQVTLEYTIDEGRQYRIGRIDISGNESVQDKVVRRVLDEYDFTPGQLYNAKIAPAEGQNSLMEKYVQRSTLAEEVIIKPVDPPEGTPDQKDVRVDVKEGMTGMIMPGVGISSDSGVMGQLIYQQQNFDIMDWPESWKEFFLMKAFRGAGQSMRIAIEPGTVVSRYTLTFSDPYFRDRPIGFDLSLMSYERFYESYDEKRGSASVGWEHRKWGKWRKSIYFRTENVTVENLDFDAPQAIRDVKGDNLITGVRLGIGRNEVDDIYMPTRGYVFRTGYEQVVGDFRFGILNGSWVHYTTLYEDILERRTVLATKLQGATILGHAPAFEKFYAGGMGRYAIRGFDYRGVSTRGLQVFDGTPPGPPTYKDPIGSDWVFTANAEVTVPLISENFSALSFVDSGCIDTGGFRYSVGGGFQILVPQWFGPVPMRFEYGVPLRKDDNDETRHFNFSMGRLF